MKDWIVLALCPECGTLRAVISSNRLETHTYRRLRCNGSGHRDHYTEIARADAWTQRNEPPAVLL